MAKFIALKTFSSLYEGLDLFSEEGLQQFKNRIQGEQGDEIALENKIPREDLMRFMQSLNSSSTILFQNWVEQNDYLKQCLLGEEITPFKDTAGVLSHQYSDGFKRFISPFLTAELLSRTSENDKELSILFSYVALLDNDDRAVVESQLFKPVRKRLDELNTASPHFTEEQELIDVIKPLCSEDLIRVVNSLSKASYALKLEYVDTIINTVRTNGCTVRFANWIFKQMEGLRLNNEHQEKIVELKKDLREGKLDVRNHGSGKTPIRWRAITTFLFVLILGGGAFYVIYFQPFSTVEDDEIADTSSFKQFTKEERKKIDSLIQSMNNPLLPDESEIDPGIPIGNGATLTLRQQSNNNLMESIYDDLSKDAEVQQHQAVDSCSLKRKKFKRYQGVKDLAKHQGSVDAVIKNESEYDVVLYVAENKTGGSVYSLFLKQGSTHEFQINRGDLVTAIAGNIYIPYVAPTSFNAVDLPSSDFKYHFCDTDANYEESINTTYEYTDRGRQKTKFMIMGNYGSYFSLMDIYGVLTAF